MSADELKFNSAQSAAEDDDEGIQFKVILDIIFARKWWILASVLLFLLLAGLYLHKTSNIYSRYTTILVKDESKGGNMGIAGELSDLGMLSAKSNVDNEIEAFKSPYLMYMVVKALNLDVTYSERNFLNIKDLYKKNPIALTFNNAKDEDKFSFKVDIDAVDSYTLYDFVLVDTVTGKKFEDDTTKIVCKPFQSVMTPVGLLSVSPTELFKEKDIDRTIMVSKLDPNLLADSYCESLIVELAAKKTQVIELTFKALSVKLAEDVLNTLLDIYNEDRLQEKKLSASLTSKFIDGRLMIIEQELGGIDNDIEKYKSHQLLTNVEAEGAKYLRESSDYSYRTLEMNNQLAIAQFLKERLSQPEDKPELLPSNSGLSDGGITGLISEYNGNVLKRDRLIANSSDKNPLVVELTTVLTGMKASIQKSLDNLIESTSMKLESLKQKESQISHQISQNPKQEKYLLSIGRQQKIKESLYLYLLQKREENELSGNMQVSNIRIITPPRGANAPVKPRKAQIVAIALIFGFIFPVGVFWLIDALNTTVRNRKDLEQLSVPFLGEVPLCGKIKDKTKGPLPVVIVVEDKNRDFANEAFRVLRTNFTFMSSSNKAKVIMYTSFFPNSGKTFVATNMALSLALTGKRILMIDLDLRKGELSNCLAKKRVGASTFLGGQSDSLKECISKTKINDNLDIIPCGVIPPNPAELLLSDRLLTMVEEAKKDYDYVMLDCTPMNMVADASIVGKLADLVLFVIREGKFERAALPDVEKLYRDNTFKHMATVLNASGASGHHYGNYGGYGGYGGYGRYGNYGSYGSSTYGSSYGEGFNEDFDDDSNTSNKD